MLTRTLALLLVILPLLGSRPALAAGSPSVTDARYFAGVNVPWFGWACDFGCGAKSGVSSPGVRASVGAGFGRLQTAGVHAVRWWVFEGDAWQINHDSAGVPTSLNPAVYADFDAALALADQYDLAYDFVLFGGPTALPRPWIVDPATRQRLADTLAPLFERYKNNPHILAWELFNEPEWDTWNDKIPLAPVQATVKLLTTTIHAHTSTAVTLGSANLEGVLLWGGLGLDFYSPHWYDPMSSGLGCARCLDVATVRANYGVDNLPIVIGELYAGPDTDALQRLKDFRAKGYSGAWAWSLFNDHTSDKMRVDLAAYTTFISDRSAPGPTPAPGPSSSAASVQLLANWVSPAYATAGQELTVNQDIQSTSDTNVLVDLEVYDDKGQQVSQTSLDNQPLSHDGITSFSTTIKLPVTMNPGQYVVKIGLFSPGGGTMYAWSDGAGTFIVQSPPPTPTPVPAPPVDDTPSSPDPVPDSSPAA